MYVNDWHLLVLMFICLVKAQNLSTNEIRLFIPISESENRIISSAYAWMIEEFLNQWYPSIFCLAKCAIKESKHTLNFVVLKGQPCLTPFLRTFIKLIKIIKEPQKIIFFFFISIYKSIFIQILHARSSI